MYREERIAIKTPLTLLVCCGRLSFFYHSALCLVHLQTYPTPSFGALITGIYRHSAEEDEKCNYNPT